MAGVLALVVVLEVLAYPVPWKAWGARVQPKPVSAALLTWPAPSPWNPDVVRQRAEKVVLPAALPRLAELTLATESIGSGWISPCGSTPAEEAWGRSGPWREWIASEYTAKEVFVQQFVVSLASSYHVVPAAQVLNQVRVVDTCKSYVSREGTPKARGEFKLAPLPGVDGQYASCERIQRGRSDENYGACTVLLARAEIVSKVRVRTASEAEAKKLLPILAAEAAKALATLK